MEAMAWHLRIDRLARAALLAAVTAASGSAASGSAASGSAASGSEADGPLTDSLTNSRTDSRATRVAIQGQASSPETALATARDGTESAAITAALRALQGADLEATAQAVAFVDVASSRLASPTESVAVAAFEALLNQALRLAKDDVHPHLQRRLAVHSDPADPAAAPNDSTSLAALRCRIVLRRATALRATGPLGAFAQRLCVPASARQPAELVRILSNQMPRGARPRPGTRPPRGAQPEEGPTADQPALDLDQATAAVIDYLCGAPNERMTWNAVSQAKSDAPVVSDALRDWFASVRTTELDHPSLLAAVHTWTRLADCDPTFLPLLGRFRSDRTHHSAILHAHFQAIERHPSSMAMLVRVYRDADANVRDRILRGLANRPRIELGAMLDLVIADFDNNRLAHSASQVLRHQLAAEPSLLPRLRPLIERALGSKFVLRAASSIQILEGLGQLPGDLVEKIVARVRTATERRGAFLAERALAVLGKVAADHPAAISLTLDLCRAESIMVRLPAVCATATLVPRGDLTTERLAESIEAAGKPEPTKPADLPVHVDPSPAFERAVVLLPCLLRDTEFRQPLAWSLALRDGSPQVATAARTLLGRAARRGLAVPRRLLQSAGIPFAQTIDAVLLDGDPARAARLDQLSTNLQSDDLDRLGPAFATTSREFQAAYARWLTARSRRTPASVGWFRFSGATSLIVHAFLEEMLTDQTAGVAEAARAALAFVPEDGGHRAVVESTRRLAAAMKAGGERPADLVRWLRSKDRQMRVVALLRIQSTLAKTAGYGIRRRAGLGTGHAPDRLGADGCHAGTRSSPHGWRTSN